MGRSIDAKCKKCRREGEKLFLKGDRCYGQKCAIVKKNYAPGDHGQTSGFRLSEYGHQLREKQKVKKSYRLRENQFHSYYEKAARRSGVTSDNFVQLLESRLDNVIYRTGLAKSRDQARQIVSHGHFSINGKPIDIPSYQVKVGDVISLRESAFNKKFFKRSLKAVDVKKMPSWVQYDPKQSKITMVARPDVTETSSAFNINLIIEHYSR